MRCSVCSQEVKPIAVVDIDGTLADYHGHFVRFAEQYLGKRLPRNYSGDREFSEYLGLEKPLYREVKLAFRQGGLHRSAPAFYNASWFMHKLREYGLEVWIATHRPYLRLDNISPDTLHWLDRLDIVYDHVVYGDFVVNKFERLLSSVEKPRIVAAVEDLTEMCYEAEEQGIVAIQMDRQHNSEAQHHLRAGDFYEALMIITRLTDQWRKNVQLQEAVR